MTLSYGQIKFKAATSVGGASLDRGTTFDYVIYANGKSNRTKIFGIFRVNPSIRPGAEVVIPETDAKKEKAITTIVQFTTVIAQVVAALATISLLQK